MTKWWMGVALLAGWVSGAAPGWCQSSPNPMGPTPLGEPTPVAPAPQQYMPSGPMPGMPGMPGPAGNMPVAGPVRGSVMASPDGGPPGPNCLPPPLPDSPSAFGDEGYAHFNQACEYYDGCGWYTTVGALGLMRSRPGHMPLALFDPQNLDTGTLPPVTQPVAEDLHDMTPSMRGGVQAAVGYFWENSKLELSAFYLPPSKTQTNLTAPGQIDAFFFNPPLGFEGDNGMWHQADTLRTSLRTELVNAEVNWHTWSSVFAGCHGLVGIRYFNLNERLQIATDDDSVSFGILDPTRVATYTVRSNSRIVAPQLGVEFNQPLLSWLAVTGTAKGAWGANFARIDYHLERGDGLAGLDIKRNETIFSHMYEAGAYVDMYFGSRWHFRGGYQAIWLLHVPDVTGQLDFNLADMQGRRNDNGSVFFHGPTLELQMLW